MSKFKIEKGVSRIARVKLQSSIDESIAADLLLLSEWSNNDKNYVVNPLLRFALSQDGEFQAYKESLSRPRPEPPTESAVAKNACHYGSPGTIVQSTVRHRSQRASYRR